MSFEYHWQWWERVTTPVEPPVPEPPSPWTLEKQMNRLARQVEKVESGRWLPRAAYKLSGKARRELKEAYSLLGETRGVLQEAKP